jgi:hypothetical protein
MNKAFVREPDDDGKGFCPRCGSLGYPVLGGTLDVHIQSQARPRLGATGWFCPYPDCSVAYFDAFDTVISISELTRPVYPKDQTASLCGCFEFYESDLDADLADVAPVRIRGLLARSQTPEARCAVLAADGRCCLTEIRRQYLQRRGG